MFGCIITKFIPHKYFSTSVVTDFNRLDLMRLIFLFIIVVMHSIAKILDKNMITEFVERLYFL